MRLGLCAVPLMMAALVGCAADATTNDGEASEELSQRGTLLVADDLRVDAVMLDGAQPATRNERFIKVTVTRKGESFSAWCDGRGERAEDQTTVVAVDCSVTAYTVSGDDDEALSFSIERTAKESSVTHALTRIDYRGDGTFLGKEARILRGDNTKGSLPLRVERADSSHERDPFAFGNYVHDALAPLLGKQVTTSEVNTALPIRSYRYLSSTDLELGVRVGLSASGALTASVENPVSVLNQPGKLASGLASVEDLRSRVMDALPHQ